MPKLYEALAEAFLAEGVDTQFVLLGDGNMHWSTAFAKLPGVHTVHVRHEHCTVAAATAYNVATGNVAVASVMCGPGVTQVMTALPAAVRARLPMVVFAGESPINAKFYNQYIDQAPLVTATGAHYIAAHSVPRMMDYVREAFHVAKYVSGMGTRPRSQAGPPMTLGNMRANGGTVDRSVLLAVPS
jgi:acetolactate synthase I/II/III large subunit